MPPSQSAIIITSCTNRKRQIGESITLRNVTKFKSLKELSDHWRILVSSARVLEPAHSLYQGRSFTEAKAAASKANAQLFIASAGHGIVFSEERLPSYNLTVTAGSTNPLVQALTRLGKNSTEWWSALTERKDERRSLSALMDATERESRLVVLAMPSSYLTMLSADIANLTTKQISRLRIITSERGIGELPAKSQGSALPYDERLEGNQAYAGTRNDFAQRALRHFITELDGLNLPLEAAKERVQQAMAALTRRSTPKREKKTDAEIEQLIKRNRIKFNNSQSAMLRWLRDEKKISCEQGRFRQLWHRMQTDVKTK